MSLKYKRVLLKISGEFLAGNQGFGFNFDIVENISNNIKKCLDKGCQIAIVVGGGNFFRGRDKNFDRIVSDNVGMLATCMNALVVCESLNSIGVKARVLSSIQMDKISEFYNRDNALRYLENNEVVIFSAGTSNPFFSTDTTASLRALEINADIVLKATLVDGVYDSDPKINKDAKKFEKISYSQIISDNLRVMDHTSAILCKENNINTFVFDISDSENIYRIINGEIIGTLVV